MPRFLSPSRRGRDPHLVSLQEPNSFEAEQYRRLRQRIEEQGLTRDLRVIAVTSPIASDGKTVTAINLAATLARARQSRVLLIDADLRKPSVGRTLGLDTCAGLLAALRRPHRPIEEFAATVEGLTVLPCAQSSARTYELLVSQPFADRVAEARRRFDYVVVDTPPVIPVPDSALLRRVLDGYVIVVGAHSTPRKLVGETLNLLDPRAVVGLVFNRDDRPLFGYYRRYYRDYFRAYVRAVHRRATA